MKYKCKWCGIIYEGLIRDKFFQCSYCGEISNVEESKVG